MEHGDLNPISSDSRAHTFGHTEQQPLNDGPRPFSCFLVNTVHASPQVQWSCDKPSLLN